MIKDPALIIERILRPSDRSLLEGLIAKTIPGAKIADWLSIAVDSDAFIETTEPFFVGPGWPLVVQMLVRTFPEVGEQRIEELGSYAATAAAGYTSRFVPKPSYDQFARQVADTLCLATAFVAGQLNGAKS